MTDDHGPIDDITPREEWEQDDDEDFEAEPIGASKHSPYSVAAFVVSAIALFQLPQNSFFFGAPLRFSFGLAPTVVMSILSLWLCRRAEGEIFAADGSLGGVGFHRAARVIATICLVFVAVTLLLVLIDANTPGDWGL